MPRIQIATISLAGVGCVLLAAAVSCEIESRRLPELTAGLEPLRVPLAENGLTRGSFKAVWSEPHHVALIFAEQRDQEAADLLARAASLTGIGGAQAVAFDFEWRALEGAREIGRGSGRNGPVGSFGGSEHGLLFGEFPVQSGRTYDVELRPGTGFERWASLKPLIAVGVNRPGPSVGLPWAEALNRPVAVTLAAFGLLFLGGAIWTVRK